MAQEIVTRAALPAPTPQISKSLSPQGLAEHRARIAFDVKTVLSAYFQPHEADEIKAAQLAWWCDELQDWTQEQVLWSLRAWNRENPRIRPTPGDIVAIMKKKRGEKYAASLAQAPAQPAPAPITDEERYRRKKQGEAILQELGFRARRVPTDD